MTNIEKWQLARNILDAKKAIDSLWYISKHVNELYETRELCNEKRSEYYINTCAVLDKSICANGNKRREVDSDGIIKRIYTERDKHYAHKDKNYITSFPYSSLEGEALSLQDELRHVMRKCSDYLPESITLDFVCYDARLFRQVEKINPEDEKRINKQKYPFSEFFKDMPVGESYTFKILYDIDDLNGLSDEEKEKYGVLFENGLTFEEGLQKRQDACVRVNVLYDKQMWCSMNIDRWNEILSFRSIGVIDKFGVINIEKLKELSEKLSFLEKGETKE